MRQLTKAALQTLESLERAGVSSWPSPAAASNAAATAGVRTSPTTAIRCRRDGCAGARGGRLARAIRQEVAVCQLCDELCTTRTQTVFGVGNPHARLCFLGEAPGADEDRQGEPFVGRAGQLLTKIIEACTLSRADVYILNMLKCRPPGNRTPLPHEVANCRGFLDRQLAHDPARVHLLPGGGGGPDLAWTRKNRSAGCAANFTTTTASRSRARTTRPICCAIRRPRKTCGTT